METEIRTGAETNFRTRKFRGFAVRDVMPRLGTPELSFVRLLD
jgi:hypothetical protein